MKRIFLLCFIAAIISCGRHTDTRPDGFHDEVLLKTTPVKDQGKSELCWIYAMFATLETEHLMQGDSVNLSVDYTARLYMRRLALESFRSGDGSSLSMRGVGPMAVELLRSDGAVPEDSYYRDTPINWQVVARKVERLVRVSRRRRLTEEKFLRALDSLLDSEIGALPQAVYMLGMKYTPVEFAHSMCGRDEYVSLTSVAGEPYGTSIRLPFEDNAFGCRGENVPKDTIVDRVRRSISSGHPVFWEGGENDNHALSLVGMGREAGGRRYFIGKNSWGDKAGSHGFVYLSERYVRNKTAVVVMRRDLGH